MRAVSISREGGGGKVGGSAGGQGGGLAGVAGGRGAGAGPGRWVTRAPAVSAGAEGRARGEAGEGAERRCTQRVNIVTREQTVKHNI